MSEVLFLVLENWEILGLILTNIGALFVKPPKIRRK